MSGWYVIFWVFIFAWCGAVAWCLVRALRGINKHTEYRADLDKLERILAACPGTPEGEEFERLVIKIEAYESEHYPIPKPTVYGALLYAMQDKNGWDAEDLIIRNLKTKKELQYLGGAWKKVGPPVLMDDWGEAG